MRLFVALCPPPQALNDVVARLDRLRLAAAATAAAATGAGAGVRLMPRDDLHVTVAFLGEVDDGRRADLDDALDRAARSWPGRYDPPPRLRLAGAGRFGEGTGAVLWIGLGGEVDSLHLIHEAVRRELTAQDLPYDPRPYRPHLTVARPGRGLDPAAVDADLAELAGYLGPAWPVTELVLMRGRWGDRPGYKGERPGYERLAAWPLAVAG